MELEKDLADIVEEEGAQEVIQVGKSGEGTITLELDSGAFFKPGGAELLDQAIPVLKSIYEEFASPIYQKFNISIISSIILLINRLICSVWLVQSKLKTQSRLHVDMFPSVLIALKNVNQNVRYVEPKLNLLNYMCELYVYLF